MSKTLSLLMAIALFAVGAVGFTTASIVSPLSTPAAHAAWYDRLPVPVGAYYRIGNAEYFYGTLNDRSQILPGVTWQVNGESGLLLKGYGNTPRGIIYWINRVLFQPIRVESN